MESLEVMPVRIRITSILKKAIYSGEYEAGRELSLTAVAVQLGVSRTPVREAFQALEAEGLITLRMNRSAVVNKIDEKFIRDNFEMRMLLESEAAAKAAANGMDVEPFLSRLSSLGRNPEMDKQEYEQLNQEIHMSIWQAADNRKLRSYLLELWNGPSTGHSINEAQLHYHKSTQEHIEILKSIAAGDSETAKKTMYEHILRSRENVLATLAQKL